MIASMKNKVKSYNKKWGSYDDYTAKLTEYVDKIQLTRIFSAEAFQIKWVYDSRV